MGKGGCRYNIIILCYTGTLIYA